MKTAEEILKKNTGHAHGLMDAMVIKSMNEYAFEACKEALKNASENSIMKYHCGHFKTDTPTQYHQHGADNIQIDKQSILSEDNIPKEVKS